MTGDLHVDGSGVRNLVLGAGTGREGREGCSEGYESYQSHGGSVRGNREEDPAESGGAGRKRERVDTY